MRITSVRHVDGPNVYIYKPILVARVDLDELTERETTDFASFSDDLLALLPGLCEHHCAKGEPGGFVERLYGGTYFGHVVEHTAIELATLCGLDVHYGKTVYVGPAGRYDMIMECKEYECQRVLIHRALELVTSILHKQACNVNSIIQEAKRVLARTALGPSTQAIVDEARRRNIPVQRLNSGSLVQLGWGIKRRLLEATITQNTSAVSVDIACDKELTKQLLRASGVPVPDGVVVYDEDEAALELLAIGDSVVIKPLDGNQGRGVSLDLKTPEEVRCAMKSALEHSSRVIIERFIPGRNIRALVVGGQFVAASERLPALVYGDGAKTVVRLIEEANLDPLRGDGHEKPLTKIVVDSVVEMTLKKQGLTLESKPHPGAPVYLRESANLSTGGQAIDITEEVQDAVRDVAERAARIIGLDVCGIDMVIPGSAVPEHIETLRPTTHSSSDSHGGIATPPCYVLEVNAAPGIRMHHHPSFGSSRPVAQAILDHLFAGNGNGRIPIVSVTGTNGKTTTTRLIGHVLRTAVGKMVGMTTTSGVWIGDRQIASGDMTGPTSARMILSDPAVEVAVLETARGGMVRGGLAYDKANVAVLTNITSDHLGQDGIDTIEDLMHIKALVGECVAEDGTVVLNADDERLVRMSSRFQAKIVYFSSSDNNQIIGRHLALGGTAFYISGGWLVEARGSLTWQVLPVVEIPITMGGTAPFQMENCLGALAALRAMGCTRQQVARGFSSFQAMAHNPGRCSLFRLPNGAHVVLDYGHNPDGFRRVGEWLQKTPHRKLKGVIGVPGDRSDEMIRQAAAQAAKVFDEFIVKEDTDKRGRRDGEVASIMAEELALVTPDKPHTIVLNETEALSRAMSGTTRGDIVVLFYEHLEAAERCVKECGGVVSETPFETMPSTVALPL